MYDVSSLQQVDLKEAHEEGPVTSLDYLHLPQHTHAAGAAAAADGGLLFLASGGTDGVIHVFQAGGEGYTLANTLDEHNAPVVAVRFR